MINILIRGDRGTIGSREIGLQTKEIKEVTESKR